MTETLLWLAPILLVSFTAGAALGFGSTVIALALGSHFFAVEELLPVLVPLNVILGTYLVGRHRGSVKWRLVLTQILPMMVAGTCAGLVLFHVLSGAAMKSAFGVLVVALSGYEILKLTGVAGPSAPLGECARRVWLLAAGVVHGVYASGGPLLVYTLGRSQLAKTEFRSTLWAVWLTLNTILLGAYAAGGSITRLTLLRCLLLAPVVVAATAVGEWSHYRIDDRVFRLAVFSLLLVVGGALVI